MYESAEFFCIWVCWNICLTWIHAAIFLLLLTEYPSTLPADNHDLLLLTCTWRTLELLALSMKAIFILIEQPSNFCYEKDAKTISLVYHRIWKIVPGIQSLKTESPGFNIKSQNVAPTWDMYPISLWNSKTQYLSYSPSVISISVWLTWTHSHSIWVKTELDNLKTRSQQWSFKPSKKNQCSYIFKMSDFLIAHSVIVGIMFTELDYI